MAWVAPASTPSSTVTAPSVSVVASVVVAALLLQALRTSLAGVTLRALMRPRRRTRSETGEQFPFPCELSTYTDNHVQALAKGGTELRGYEQDSPTRLHVFV